MAMAFYSLHWFIKKLLFNVKITIWPIAYDSKRIIKYPLVNSHITIWKNPHFSWVNQRTKLPWLQVRKLLVIARGYHNPHPRDLHSKSEVTRWGPPRYKLGWMRQPIPRHSEWKVLMMLMFGQACSQHPGWFWGGLGNTSAKSRIFGTQLAITYLEWVGTTLFGVRHFERVAHFLIQGMTRQYLECGSFMGNIEFPSNNQNLFFGLHPIIQEFIAMFGCINIDCQIIWHQEEPWAAGTQENHNSPNGFVWKWVHPEKMHFWRLINQGFPGTRFSNKPKS